jgi:hypothetical protein
VGSDYTVELTVAGNERVDLDAAGGIVDRTRVPLVAPTS